jgi:hypothetical protein
VEVTLSLYPSALKPSECTTTPPSISSFMRKRKCSKENRKSFVYLLVTNTMTKKLLRVIFFTVNWNLLCSLVFPHKFQLHCKNNNQKLVYFHTKKRTRHIYTKIRTKIY